MAMLTDEIEVEVEEAPENPGALVVRGRAFLQQLLTSLEMADGAAALESLADSSMRAAQPLPPREPPPLEGREGGAGEGGAGPGGGGKG